MASTMKPDRELSEAAFHCKYGYMTGWDDARDMVWSAVKAAQDERVHAALLFLHQSMDGSERDVRRDEYVSRIDQ